MTSKLNVVKVPYNTWSLAINVIDEATSTDLFKYMPITEFSFTRLYDKITLRATFELINSSDLSILKKFIDVLLPRMDEGILYEKVMKSKRFYDGNS